MNLQEICLQAKRAVEDTATFIGNQLGKVKEGQIKDKDHNSLVSYVDKEAEKMLVKELSAIVPEATFLTEEGTVEPKKGTWRWIIDPLDGTTNFLHQIPVFSVSVGLQHHDKIVVGIVHEINLNECFYAWEGGGAFLNDQKISTRQNPHLQFSVMATGYPSRSFGKIDAYFDVLKELMQSTRGMRRMGSAAVDLAYVACGRFDGFFEYGLSAWDVAAGILLIQEAGGKTTDFKGMKNELFGGEMLASNGKIHNELINIFAPKFQ